MSCVNILSYHDIFEDIESDPLAISVCPVNCVPGVMGAGLAKAFAAKFPQLYALHREAAKTGQLAIGKCQLVTVDEPIARRILLFPTKDHWRKPSELEYISAGLWDIAETWLPTLADPVRILMPALGSGLGGLDWNDVLNCVIDWAHDTEKLGRHVELSLYPPGK